MTNEKNWKTLSEFVHINSPWLRLIGEKIEDNQGQILDYWRIEKADSVVIITIQEDYFLFPIPSYRPGLGKVTLDFPGGRIPAGKTPIEVVPHILARELGIPPDSNLNLTPLNRKGWAINSSFSNQKLYGFVAQIGSEIAISADYLGAKYPITPEGIKQLLESLTCLQCRSLLLEWIIDKGSTA
ncbi:NUDIX hydrolase [Gloeothece citriformis PCC 7424]|uniref:NUDIX hydrolase n=1 Tax=Gloeothece citriformis (strain PCC 7424) TaxID=65393 RepID=B7KFE5_GLOC7|nr:NUDIX hydrolase [Gloeothece citriformis]ACK71861.1 NUDIX hydrolase [Gloeothece citriformis PCC 7424]